MKLKKIGYLALFALIISGALVTFGCDDPAPTPSETTFTVTPYNPSGGNTNRLDFTFSSAVTGLTKDMITITVDNGKIASGNFEVTKGNLIGSDTKWQLSITLGDGFADTYSCSVSIFKSGVSSSSRDISIINNTGKADFRVTASEVKDSKSDLIINLSKNVDLSDGDVIIKDGSGKDVTKGTALSKTDNPSEYKLTITGVDFGTKINVTIQKEGVNTNEKSITLSDNPTTTDPPPSGPGSGLIKIEIEIDLNVPYSTIVTGANGQGSFSVEAGYPRKYKFKSTPATANPDVVWSTLDPSVATVDKNGLVTPNKAEKPGKTILTITAKDKDGASATSYMPIEVIDRIYPSGMGFEAKEGNISAGGYNPGWNGYIGNGSVITLYIGDPQPLILTGTLWDKGEPTNDQKFDTISTTFNGFTLTPYYSVTTGDVPLPRTQFTLTSKTGNTSTPSGTNGETITFRSDYNYDKNKANISVKWALIPIIRPGIYLRKDPVGTPPPYNTKNDTNNIAQNGQDIIGDFSVVLGGPIYMVFQSSAPYDKISLSPVGALATNSLTISAKTDIITGKVERYDVRMKTGATSLDFVNYAGVQYKITSPDKDADPFIGSISFKYTAP